MLTSTRGDPRNGLNRTRIGVDNISYSTMHKSSETSKAESGKFEFPIDLDTSVWMELSGETAVEKTALKSLHARTAKEKKNLERRPHICRPPKLSGEKQDCGKPLVPRARAFHLWLMHGTGHERPPGKTFGQEDTRINSPRPISKERRRQEVEETMAWVNRTGIMLMREPVALSRAP